MGTKWKAVKLKKHFVKYPIYYLCVCFSWRLSRFSTSTRSGRWRATQTNIWTTPEPVGETSGPSATRRTRFFKPPFGLKEDAFRFSSFSGLSDVLSSKQNTLMKIVSRAKTRFLIPPNIFRALRLIIKPQRSLCSVADFQKLQEAKEVLCDEGKRKNYDAWRRSGVAIPFHDWRALNDSVKTVSNVFTLCFPELRPVVVLQAAPLFAVDALGCENQEGTDAGGLQTRSCGRFASRGAPPRQGGVDVCVRSWAVFKWVHFKMFLRISRYKSNTRERRRNYTNRSKNTFTSFIYTAAVHNKSRLPTRKPP